MYVCAENAGQDYLVANRTDPREWERFKMEEQPSRPGKPKRIALIAEVNGKYVYVKKGAHTRTPHIGNRLIADRDKVGSNQVFEVFYPDENDPSKIILKALNAGYVIVRDDFLCANAQNMECNGHTDPYLVFTVEEQ